MAVIKPSDIEWGEQLGGGGFGAVYRGKWNRADVAIKRIFSSTQHIPQSAIQALLDEAEITIKMRHPNVIQVRASVLLLS